MGCARRAGSSPTFQAQSYPKHEGNRMPDPEIYPGYLRHPRLASADSGLPYQCFIRVSSVATERSGFLRNLRITEPWLPSFASVQLRVQPERRLINVNQG